MAVKFSVERKTYRICLGHKRNSVIIEQANQGWKISASTSITLSKQVGEEIINRSCISGGVGLMTWRDRHFWALLEEKQNQRGTFLDLWFCEGGKIKRFCVPLGKNGTGWRRLGDALLWCDGIPHVQFQERGLLSGEPASSSSTPRSVLPEECNGRGLREWQSSLARFQELVVKEIVETPSLSHGCEIKWVFEPVEMCLGWKVVVCPLARDDYGCSPAVSKMKDEAMLNGGRKVEADHSIFFENDRADCSQVELPHGSCDQLHDEELDGAYTAEQNMGLKKEVVQIGKEFGVDALPEDAISYHLWMPSDLLCCGKWIEPDSDGSSLPVSGFDPRWENQLHESHSESFGIDQRSTCEGGAFEVFGAGEDDNFDANLSLSGWCSTSASTHLIFHQTLCTPRLFELNEFGRTPAPFFLSNHRSECGDDVAGEVVDGSSFGIVNGTGFSYEDEKSPEQSSGQVDPTPVLHSERLNFCLLEKGNGTSVSEGGMDFSDISSPVGSPLNINTVERISVVGTKHNVNAKPLVTAQSGFRYFFCRKKLRKKVSGRVSVTNSQQDSKCIQAVEVEGVPKHIRKAVDNFVEAVDPAGVAGRLSLLSKLYEDLSSPPGKRRKLDDPWDEALGPKPTSQDLEDILAEHLKESEDGVVADIL